MKTKAAVVRGLGQKWEVEDINQGYDDMFAGVSLRGLIRH